jgi:hypothetical protein
VKSPPSVVLKLFKPYLCTGNFGTIDPQRRGSEMARRKRPAPAPTAGIPGVQDGPLDLVEITRATDAWSEYKLEDGSTLLVKPSLIDVRRARGQFTPEGDPLYIVKTGILISTRAPAKLKKKQRS